MKKIKIKIKWWLAKKLQKQLLPYVMISLTNEQMEFLWKSYSQKENRNFFSRFVK